jgi:site-specific recombinase XerD
MKAAAIPRRTFCRFTEEYLHLRLRMNHQLSSVVAARKDLRLFIRYCREHEIRSIQGATIIEFMNWASECRGNGSASLNRKRASLCSYIRHLKLRQVTGAAEFPLDFIPRARHPYSGPPTTLEPDEVDRLLHSIDRSSVLGYRDFTLYSMLYCLGLRLGEALAINIGDIDYEKQCILIHGKGRRERTLPLTIELIRLFKQWIKHRKGLFNVSSSNALFMSKKGNRLSLRTAEENFQHIVASVPVLSVGHVVPHTLRHCFASHALETEHDLVIIKTILGHVLMKSTEIYLHPSQDLLRKSSDNHVSTELIKSVRKRRVWIRGIQARRC